MLTHTITLQAKSLGRFEKGGHRFLTSAGLFWIDSADDGLLRFDRDAAEPSEPRPASGFWLNVTCESGSKSRTHISFNEWQCLRKLGALDALPTGEIEIADASWDNLGG